MDKRNATEIARNVSTITRQFEYDCEVDIVSLGDEGWSVHLFGTHWQAFIHFDLDLPDAAEPWNLTPIFHCAVDNLARPLPIPKMPVVRSHDLKGILRGMEQYFEQPA